ncbi:uncharacterized protein [Thunnus thynnus]|uniref:uncharacterized protein n=1 Tax=Thunnus thynnus TaxID=8237 RepID=UPI003529CD0A
MPKPPQLAPFNAKEQWLYSKPPPNVRAPHPISKAEPRHSPKEIHFGRLDPRSHSFSHYPKLVTIASIPLQQQQQQQQQHQHRCLHHCRCWILRLLPGSASSFSSGSSSWNWEGEGDQHLPACRGPSARHQEERRKDGEGILEEAHQERRGEATPWVTGEQRKEEERGAEQEWQQQQGNRMSPPEEDQKSGAALQGHSPEEPLMEPCLTLQRGVFNQCDCPTFSICVCVCLPLEPEEGLLMAAVMAMVVMVVVMMMMRWQWHCSHGFWLSSLCLLKDSLR